MEGETSKDKEEDYDFLNKAYISVLQSIASVGRWLNCELSKSSEWTKVVSNPFADHTHTHTHIHIKAQAPLVQKPIRASNNHRVVLNLALGLHREVLSVAACRSRRSGLWPTETSQVALFVNHRDVFYTLTGTHASWDHSGETAPTLKPNEAGFNTN